MSFVRFQHLNMQPITRPVSLIPGKRTERKGTAACKREGGFCVQSYRWPPPPNVCTTATILVALFCPYLSVRLLSRLICRSPLFWPYVRARRLQCRVSWIGAPLFSPTRACTEARIYLISLFINKPEIAGATFFHAPPRNPSSLPWHHAELRTRPDKGLSQMQERYVITPAGDRLTDVEVSRCAE